MNYTCNDKIIKISKELLFKYFNIQLKKLPPCPVMQASNAHAMPHEKPHLCKAAYMMVRTSDVSSCAEKLWFPSIDDTETTIAAHHPRITVGCKRKNTNFNVNLNKNF